MVDVTVTWVQGHLFVASGTGGRSIVLHVPAGREAWQGFKPSELLLAALAGLHSLATVSSSRALRFVRFDTAQGLVVS